MKDLELTAVFVKGEYAYTAYLEELKGVITQGESIQEAEENLYDALELYLRPDSTDDFVIDIENQSQTRKPFMSMSRVV